MQKKQKQDLFIGNSNVIVWMSIKVSIFITLLHISWYWIWSYNNAETSSMYAGWHEKVHLVPHYLRIWSMNKAESYPPYQCKQRVCKCVCVCVRVSAEVRLDKKSGPSKWQVNMANNGYVCGTVSFKHIHMHHVSVN